jgi:ADP-ribose pyrophosphatase YjhB (NUDIX family)
VPALAISPYYASLRERIGHDLLLIPAVTVLPIDDSGRLLLVRKADTDKWGTIGGAIEPGEAPEEAARREALEEAGVELALTQLLTAVGGPECRVTFSNGDEMAFVSVLYAARVVGGEMTPDNDETTEVAWHQREAIAHLDLGAADRHLLETALPLLD